MNDRELLELAAKAIGKYLECWHNEKIGFEDCAGNLWNPLTDDGDALRLAVKLRLDIDFFAEYVNSCNYLNNNCNADEPYEEDPYAATRRAIVRAAAEIGKTK
jgi:hypothetical protein